MNTAPGHRCQCDRPARPVRSGRLWLAGLLSAAALSSQAAGADAPPSPAPPAWQSELNATRVLQTTLALTPAADPAEDAGRRKRLGTLYGQLAARYPNEAAVQKAAGNFFAQDHQDELAVSYWQRAQTLDPRDADTAESLGTAFMQAGRVSDACAEYQRAVDAEPNSPVYHFALANVLYLFRREVLAPPARPTEQAALDEALGHFRKAAELSPTDPSLAQAYAETFYLLPQPDWRQALAAWQAVLALSGEQTDFANGHLARVSLKMGRRDDMEMYLQRIRSTAFDDMKRSLRQKAAKAALADKPLPR